MVAMWSRPMKRRMDRLRSVHTELQPGRERGECLYMPGLYFKACECYSFEEDYLVRVPGRKAARDGRQDSKARQISGQITDFTMLRTLTRQVRQVMAEQDRCSRE